ncbi:MULTISPECIES: class I SAM-dependent methyltransferase [Streptomyces]|uniref:class I SAM-dependent methyltransferase n=1 Tax=Streptomyces TaxID=1883 RepID=UPI000A443440|nr:class I SAM-dependent methyltransferase [Streptomyces virginiae]
MTQASSNYVFGHSREELDRLAEQGAMYAPMTRQFLTQAGIRPGMHVLDVGCGTGDVTLLVADIVGESGSVTALDKSPAAISATKARTQNLNVPVHVVNCNLDDVHGEMGARATYDAVVGRFFLAYVKDGGATLRSLASRLAPGGLVLMIEADLRRARTVPEGSLYGRCIDLMANTFEQMGHASESGAALYGAFIEAGLPLPEMDMRAIVTAGPNSLAYDYLAGTISSLLPAMEALGMATSEELDPATLSGRLRAEALSSSAVIYGPPMTAAWACI